MFQLLILLSIYIILSKKLAKYEYNLLKNGKDTKYLICEEMLCI